MATKKKIATKKARKKSSLSQQNQECSRLLGQLVPLLAPEDRKEAMARLGISYVTISRYLQGNVPNLVLGIDLLNFFTERIKNRNEQLNIFLMKKPGA